MVMDIRSHSCNDVWGWILHWKILWRKPEKALIDLSSKTYKFNLLD
jgi:hypothetical protein